MRYLAIFAAVLLLVGAAGESYGAGRAKGSTMQREQIPTGFLNKTMMVNGKPRHYVLYVPRDYTPDKAWPLVVFLHGMGERGSDGLAQSDVGIGRAIRFHPDRFPCLVVMPQCPGKVVWNKAIEDIETSIKDTRSAYTVDADRLYLTGLSMGGFATWQYGAANPRKFAALMPVCGGGNVQDAAKLAHIPIWAFHGGADSVVPPQKSQEMVEAVKKAGGNVQYTEYPGVDHNSWDKAYGSKEAIAWLLKQRK